MEKNLKTLCHLCHIVPWLGAKGSDRWSQWGFQDERRIENLALSGATLPIIPYPLVIHFNPNCFPSHLIASSKSFWGMTEIKSRVAAMSGEGLKVIP